MTRGTTSNREVIQPMTDVRRTGEPQRVSDESRLGTRFRMPISGDVDNTWRHSFHEQLTAEAQRRGLPDRESFVRTMSVSADEITFFLDADASTLRDHLDAIDSSIGPANAVTDEEEERAGEAAARAAREIQEHEARLDEQLQAWSAEHPPA